jgi:hypothetical protein
MLQLLTEGGARGRTVRSVYADETTVAVAFDDGTCLLWESVYVYKNETRMVLRTKPLTDDEIACCPEYVAAGIVTQGEADAAVERAADRAAAAARERALAEFRQARAGEEA